LLRATSQLSRSFWELIATAVLLGVVGAAAGLVFLGVTGVGADWYGDPGPGWYDGELWWVAVAAAAGLVVGILRRVLAMPSKTPGLYADGGLDFADVARHVGHSDPSTTAEYVRSLGHRPSDTAKRAVQLLDPTI
jgi:hypothetical protein